MHVAELLARRPVPASAVFLALTQRCPLGCRHCSTMSGPRSPQLSAAHLRRFAASFTVADHPEFLLLTGGEPLLRPRLVRALAGTAGSAGTRSYLLTGAFFACAGKTPAAIRAALESVDHVAVSIDEFHEAAVPRPRVFRVLHELLDAGRDVSIQACGTGPGDPYLAGLAEHVGQEFGERVPMLVTILRPVGRARAWLPLAARPAAAGPRSTAAPCDLVSWPVVGFDGTIVACCNPDVLGPGPVPEHLRLGHISSATWPEIRRKTVSSAVLRGLRIRGPLRLAERCAADGAAGTREAPSGYCEACRSLSARTGLARSAEADAARPAFALIEQQAIAVQRAAGPVAFARKHGDPSRADLVLTGYTGPTGGAD